MDEEPSLKMTIGNLGITNDPSSGHFRIVFCGGLQSACLATEFVARHPSCYRILFSLQKIGFGRWLVQISFSERSN